MIKEMCHTRNLHLFDVNLLPLFCSDVQPSYTPTEMKPELKNVTTTQNLTKVWNSHFLSVGNSLFRACSNSRRLRTCKSQPNTLSSDFYYWGMSSGILGNVGLLTDAHEEGLDKVGESKMANSIKLHTTDWCVNVSKDLFFWVLIYLNLVKKLLNSEQIWWKMDFKITICTTKTL